MGKVFILAIDALEHYFVEEWNLKNLMQKTYGSIDVSKKYGRNGASRPYTPIVWTSFITGKPPSVHGVDKWDTYGKFLDWVRQKTPLSRIKGKRKISSKLGILPRFINREDWKDKNLSTIFDAIKPSIALFIPAYNERETFREDIFLTLWTRTKSIDECVNKIWEIHELRIKEMYERLNDDWELFMVWFDLADLMGHICYGRRFYEFRKAYEVLDDLAFRIKSVLPEDVIMLIASDHGMKGSEDGVTGTHSNHSFWSLNIETDWKPKDITDIAPKILELCKK